jgi:micrococcal nuclease
MKKAFMSSKWIFSLVFVVAVVLLVVKLYAEPQEIKVKEVIDGDTIILSNDKTVRYIGIDAPDEGCWLTWEATKENEKMVKGKEVTVKYDIDTLERDNQGRRPRILAYVWVDSLLVNEELLKKGLAWVRIVSPNLKYRERFIVAQKQARAKKIGVWSIPVSPETCYVATKVPNSEFIFHRPDCEHAKKIKEPTRFETRDDALDAGYRPCKKCMP